MIDPKALMKLYRGGRRRGGGVETAAEAPALKVEDRIAIYFEGRPKRLGCGRRLVVVTRIARDMVTVLDPFHLLLVRLPLARASRIAAKWGPAVRPRFSRADRARLMSRSREFDRIGVSYGRDGFLRALHALAVAGRAS